ncbi:hypothetical protein RvY_12957-2 [Ramazzottius varieornatus]|uniref:Uncharacterized protein n=1 Tax=Ramazzottius varieornatus TaxID=947166 RepID=A0A1D1VQC0_RAMVA|nr:hypothetical protein RvY_12957-2 [Ramazzottius varieornatus]
MAASANRTRANDEDATTQRQVFPGCQTRQFPLRYRKADAEGERRQRRAMTSCYKLLKPSLDGYACCCRSRNPCNESGGNV